MKVIEITSQIILILPQASVEDAYSPPIDRSTAMIFRVFSSLLDENTAWFALNERLCGKPSLHADFKKVRCFLYFQTKSSA